MSAQATLPGLQVAPRFRTAAGSPVAVEVTVTNRAPAPRVVSVAAIGVDATWLPAALRTDPLAPGQSVTVTLTLTPAVGTVPAQYPLAITAQALDPRSGGATGSGAAMADTVLVVNPRNQLTLDLRPRWASAASSRRLKLTLRNSGEETARIRLAVQASPRLQVRFRSDDIEVPPRSTREVRGRASLPRARLVGGVRQHTYTVSARGTEAVRHIDGSLTQRPVVGTALLKVVALLAVLSVWVGAAVVFVPELADRIGANQTETTTEQADGGAGTEGGDGSGNEGGDSGGSGGSGDSSGSGSSSDGSRAQQAADTEDEVGLGGTVVTDHPGGVRVSLRPTSLVDEEAQRGIGVGVPASELGGTGMALASAFLNSALDRTEPDRTATTTADGSWAFADVAKPGYYLLTFGKLGYQSRSYVVDAASEAASEPLEVELTAGEGRLSGTVTGPHGAVDGATVTITDGTNTITTSSNSRGRVGHWSVNGLSTPGAYVVQAAKPGLSLESALVDLGAGGSESSDLRLRYGVASLSGKVRARNERGRWTGVGGAQVTVRGSDGLLRTVTTLTRGEKAPASTGRASQNFVGTYTLPGLPVPGEYIVTLSGPGLQTQTSKVRLRTGQSGARVNGDLVSASGTVTGIVRSGHPPVVGAGLVLSNGDNTYKTMSTSSPRGNYLFNGVQPGTYTLSTQYFGFVTDHLTVNVRAGHTTEVDPTIDEIRGGALTGRSLIKGRVIDAGTGLAIDCHGAAGDSATTDPEADCVHASVVEEAVKAGDPDELYETSFAPTAAFTLPDDEHRLLPGLHTVRISAPHYDVSTATVQVPYDGTANAGTIELIPAPVITGTITAAIGSPTSPTCIWAVPAGQAEPDKCVTEGSAACKHLTATFDVTATEPEPVCAYVDGLGSYSIEVAQHGYYAIYVQPRDGKYLGASSTQTLTPGDTQSYNVQLHRKGQLDVTVSKLGKSGGAEPAPDTTITLTPTPTLDPPVKSWTTNGSGRATIEGLEPGQTYRVRVEHGEDLSAVRNVEVGLDQVEDLDVMLTNPIDDVLGRVIANIDGDKAPVEGASLAITAPHQEGDDPIGPATAELTTDDEGCFAIQPEDAEVEPGPAAGACDTSWPGSSLVRMTFLSTTASSIEIGADGYQDRILTNQELATTRLNEFNLVPIPIPVGTLAVTTAPGSSGIDWTKVAFTVDSPSGGSGSIAVTASAAASGDGGVLTWNDTRVSPGEARPGTYAITASATGYQTATATLYCPVAATACTFDDPDTAEVEPGLVLPKLGSVVVDAKDADGAVAGARFTLLRKGKEVGRKIATGTDPVHFDELVPGVGDYTVRVEAAGHEFGTTGTSGELPITCDGSSTTLTVAAGSTTDCTVELTRLGGVEGTIQGILALPDATTPIRKLSGAQVELTRCFNVDSGYCTDTDPSTETEARTAVVFTATADDEGSFRVTGDLDHEGLDKGDWLLTASSPGFSLPVLPADAPDDALPGVVITDLATDADTHRDVSLYIDPVRLTVKLRDQAGKPVAGATVQLTETDETLVESLEPDGDSGTYTLETVVPGQYLIKVTKAGLITSTTTYTATEGDPADTQIVHVTRGASTATGYATDATILDPDPGVNGVTVELLACEEDDPDDCATDVSDGTDGKPLKATTATHLGKKGWYQFRNVPDGWYEVRFTKHGYLHQDLGAYEFRYDLAAVSAIDAELQPVTRKVVISIDGTWEDDDLGDSKVGLSRPEGPELATQSLVLQEKKGDNHWTATFNQVPWGCWDVELQLAAGHVGTPSGPTGGPDDTELTCDSDMAAPIEVPGTEDSAPAAASMVVDEGRLDVRAAAKALFDHTPPTTVAVTVSHDGTDAYSNATFPVSSAFTSIWLPTQTTYTVTAARTPTDPFWPEDQASVTVPENPPATPRSRSMTVQEEAAHLEVTVAGARRRHEATLVITAGDGNTEAVPSEYESPVTTDGGTYTFDLPGGAWDVTATLAGESDSGSKTLGAPGAYTLDLDPSDPPDPPDPSDPPDPPDPTDTPSPSESPSP